MNLWPIRTPLPLRRNLGSGPDSANSPALIARKCPRDGGSNPLPQPSPLLGNAEPGDVFDLFTIEADGTGLTSLTPESTGSDFNANWSPDGRLVAFTGEEEGLNGLFTVDSAGHGRTRVTSTVAEEHDD